MPAENQALLDKKYGTKVSGLYNSVDVGAAALGLDHNLH